MHNIVPRLSFQRPDELAEEEVQSKFKRIIDFHRLIMHRIEMSGCFLDPIWTAEILCFINMSRCVNVTILPYLL